jgi:hypothetical protein
VSDLQSPQTLAARAAALGMVPGGPPAFLRLSDGKVLGQAIAAPAGPAVAPTVAALQTPVTPTAPTPATARAATVPAKASTQVTTPVAPAVKAPPGLSAGSTWTLVTGGTP